MPATALPFRPTPPSSATSAQAAASIAPELDDDDVREPDCEAEKEIDEPNEVGSSLPYEYDDDPWEPPRLRPRRPAAAAAAAAARSIRSVPVRDRDRDEVENVRPPPPPLCLRLPLRAKVSVAARRFSRLAPRDRCRRRDAIVCVLRRIRARSRCASAGIDETRVRAASGASPCDVLGGRWERAGRRGEDKK